MFTLLSALKLITEVALLALCGRGLLGWLAGARRESNFFYQLLKITSQPAVQLARFLSPRVVLDRHVPLVAFLVLCMAWLGLTWAKIDHCLSTGVNLCQ